MPWNKPGYRTEADEQIERLNRRDTSYNTHVLIDTSTALTGKYGQVVEYEHMALYTGYSRVDAKRRIFTYEEVGPCRRTMLDEYFQICREEWRHCNGNDGGPPGCGEFLACNPDNKLVAALLTELRDDNESGVFSDTFRRLFDTPENEGVDKFVEENWPHYCILHSLSEIDVGVGTVAQVLTGHK